MVVLYSVGRSVNLILTTNPLPTGLNLERARDPDALYFALGLSCFASSEPGWLFLIGMDSKCSSWLSEMFEKSFESFSAFFPNWIVVMNLVKIDKRALLFIGSDSISFAYRRVQLNLPVYIFISNFLFLLLQIYCWLKCINYWFDLCSVKSEDIFYGAGLIVSFTVM